MQYLLRVEGVNFDNFIYDAAKLPVVRGGSAALLEAPRKLYDSVFNKLGLDLEQLSMGASSGLFRFEAEEGQGEEILRDVEQFLRSDIYEHATFVVDVIPAPENFRAGHELLIAQNRWNQMQSLSMALPEPGNHPAIADTWEGVLPAVEYLESADPDEKPALSKSIKDRREKGKRSGRQSFYKAIANYELGDLQLAEDFNDLAADPPKSVSKILAGKMAVIYLDGNKFGERARKAGDSPDGLKKWDEEIRGKRGKLLQSLLDEIRADGTWFRDVDLKDGGEKGPRLRFEVLVWGGDDSLIVVPAWKGWWTLQRIYELTKEWRDDHGEHLTHSAGLVFCGAKAPIHRVKALAENLCELAKGESQARDRERGDVFTYQVLESFDHIGRDVEEHLKERTPGTPGDEWNKHWVLRASGMEMAAETKAKLDREEMPMRKLHAMVRKLLANQDVKKEREALGDAFPELGKALGIVEGGSDAVYLHALELWRYLAPEQAHG